MEKKLKQETTRQLSIAAHRAGVLVETLLPNDVFDPEGWRRYLVILNRLVGEVQDALMEAEISEMPDLRARK